MLMHIVIFLVGLAILIMTLYFGWTDISSNEIPAANQGADWFSFLRGLVGLTGGLFAIVLSQFYRSPINNISKSITRLVKIDVAFLGYLRQINQIDATFKQLYLAPSGFNLDYLEKTVDKIDNVVSSSLKQIEVYLAVEDAPDSGGLSVKGKTAADALQAQLRGQPAVGTGD